MCDKVADDTVAVVNGIDDSQLSDPTPCAEFDVRGLVNHLFHIAGELHKGVNGEHIAPLAQPQDHIGQGGDWRARYADTAKELAATLADPRSAEGKAVAGIPRHVFVKMPLIDLLVHGWDLAQATGQSYRPDQASVEVLYELTRDLAALGRATGAFQSVHPVPEDAETFDKLLGLTGRNPEWTP
ncbi:TIGR03086 family metal-binding protein [Natronoglycomyces albus]|uniref:TIGR03086 family protein n=1 Tax=Natronoglycomyces albus TaxID=2811108 RepID=A0A895XRX1_9ACTN|nr:TIGR03086 family metal-binding protein [Natronoglycomyces albus]QSB05010.1 TIGR03086 family protein [Natronoglycomyces albus]